MLAWQAEVAQSVEHTTENRGVGSSILPLGTSRLFPATLPKPAANQTPAPIHPSPLSEGGSAVQRPAAPPNLSNRATLSSQKNRSAAQCPITLTTRCASCASPAPIRSAPRMRPPRSAPPAKLPPNTLNKPEQTRTNLNKIRTNPNTAERSDQIGTPLESPQNTLKKRIPNKPERSDECASCRNHRGVGHVNRVDGRPRRRAGRHVGSQRSASARYSAMWRGRRSVKWPICWRQETPLTATGVDGCARIAGKRRNSPIARETS